MESSRGPCVIIVNPSKLSDLEAAKAKVNTRFVSAGEPEPEWLETTVEDPGIGMAEEALRRQPRLIVAMGGDGTVRTVAGVVRGTGVSFGFLPAGTGNLLARNLDIPVDDLDAALDVVLGRSERLLDVGVLHFTGADSQQRSEPFLVIAGAGLDGYVMDNTRPELKSRVGWYAYLEAGVKGIFRKGFRAAVRCGDTALARRQVRCVMAANCGILPGGIHLVPGALPDDRQLETVVLSPQGVIGWFNALLAIASRHRVGHDVVQIIPGTSMAAVFGRPQTLQVDGDALGETLTFDVTLDAGSLPTRAPARKEAHE